MCFHGRQPAEIKHKIVSHPWNNKKYYLWQMKDINMDSSKRKKKSTKCTTETPTTPNNNYITDNQQTPAQVKPKLKELLKRIEGFKESYRPKSILPVVAKIFGKLPRKQGTMFMNQFLSKFQYGFRKGYIAQHYLLAVWETRKPPVDISQTFGALLTDISKAFESLPFMLLIAKLNAYEFHLKALKLMNNSRGNQRTKANESYSSWKKILFRAHRSYDLLCSTYFSVIFFLFLWLLALLVMSMTIPFLKQVKTLMLLPKLWECQPKCNLNGLRIIKWKTTKLGSIWD